LFFWHGKTFYLFFLILYSYLILFSFKPKISVEEWIMLGWLLTMMIDEFRDVSVIAVRCKLLIRICNNNNNSGKVPDLS